jgi:hypothetical protein
MTKRFQFSLLLGVSLLAAGSALASNSLEIQFNCEGPYGVSVQGALAPNPAFAPTLPYEKCPQAKLANTIGTLTVRGLEDKGLEPKPRTALGGFEPFTFAGAMGLRASFPDPNGFGVWRFKACFQNTEGVLDYQWCGLRKYASYSEDEEPTLKIPFACKPLTK